MSCKNECISTFLTKFSFRVFGKIIFPQTFYASFPKHKFCCFGHHRLGHVSVHVSFHAISATQNGIWHFHFSYNMPWKYVSTDLFLRCTLTNGHFRWIYQWPLNLCSLHQQCWTQRQVSRMVTSDRVLIVFCLHFSNNVYAKDMKKPIPQNTILTLDKDSGKVINAWGANMFFLPHMVIKFFIKSSENNYFKNL